MVSTKASAISFSTRPRVDSKMPLTWRLSAVTRRVARILATLSCGLVLALLLAVCGSGASTPNSTGSASPTASVPSSAQPPATRLPSSTPQVGIDCGVERWSVKTLSDQDAGRVNFTPVQTTVQQLISIAPPPTLPQSSRIPPTELTVFSVTVRVIEFKLEDDRDFHVVIGDLDDPSLTMIVEFPDAAQCSGAVGSAHAQEMITARQTLVAAFGQPSSSHFTMISGTATLSGVGFFDFKHGQTGVAPNAIELHPVLSFSASATAVVPPPGPATTDLPANVVAEYPCEASDCNCSDFPTHAEAQRIFEKHGGSRTNNWSGLDRDRDGIACESLR